MTLRSWFYRICLLVVSLLVAVGVTEIMLLAYESQLAPFQMPRPGTRGTIDLAALNYNDTTAETDSDDDEFRILSLGDSFTYSVMRPEFSYSGVLQTRLNQAAPFGVRVRVVNLGEPATSVNDYTAAYRYWSRIFEHDATLFHIYLGNDVLDVAYEFVPPEWTPNRVFAELDHSVAHGRQRRIPRKYSLRLFDYLYAAALRMRPGQTPRESPPDPYNMASLENLSPDAFLQTHFVQLDNFDPRKFEALLPGYRAMARFFRFAESIATSGIPVAIALGPSELQVDPELRREVSQRFEVAEEDYDLTLSARILGALAVRLAPSVTWIDMVAPFQIDYSTRSKDLYHRRNTHWGEAGNRLAGEILAAHLSTSWLNATNHRRRTLAPPDTTRPVTTPLSAAPDDATAAYVRRILDSIE